MSKSIKRYIDLVYGSALRRPDDIAIVCGEDRLTFRQVHKRAGCLGAAFRAQGLVAGDRIALLADNELQYLEIQAACLRSGFTLVPLNVRLTDPELEYILRDCAPALFEDMEAVHELERFFEWSVTKSRHAQSWSDPDGKYRYFSK